MVTCGAVGASQFNQRVSSCGEATCPCGNRCPKCRYNFTGSPSEVCSECDPGICERHGCGRTTTHLYRKTVKVTSTQVKSLLLCVNCYESLPNICETCKRTTDILVQDKNCPECHYGKEWVIQRGVKEICPSCKESTIVDVNQGVCRDCFVSDAIEKSGNSSTVKCPGCGHYTHDSAPNGVCSTCRALRRKCVTCSVVFLPPSSDQFECGDCRPVCVGCGNDFAAKSYRQIHCDTCATKVVRGECVDCGKNSDPVNGDGVCSTCAKKRPKFASRNGNFLCIRCDTRPVNEGRGICSTCAPQTFTCPSCKLNVIDSDDLLCKNCAQSSEKHYQNLRRSASGVL